MTGKPDAASEADHLTWLVNCRSQNQATSLTLYKLMTENIERLKKDNKLATIGIALVAVSFNLWRAVFLADANDGRADRVDHAIAFLKTLISDNAINYPQDKNARAWTFMSYLNNARFRLASISEDDPHILPNFVKMPKLKGPKATWEHLQANTNLAVGNFENALKQQ